MTTAEAMDEHGDAIARRPIVWTIIVQHDDVTIFELDVMLLRTVILFRSKEVRQDRLRVASASE
jgi:hypothetical protein